MNQPVSLFGGGGFIGSNYAKLYPDSLVESRDGFTASYPDLIDFISTTSNYNILDEFELDIQTNLIHLVNLLAANKGTYNYISSWFCYGKNNFGEERFWPQNERYNCKPNGLYSISKLAAEKILRSWTETSAKGIRTGPKNYRILRLCNVIGNDPRADNKKNAFEWLLRKVVAGEDVPIYDGDNYRDFLHVEDVCRAIHTCVTKGDLDSIYNIGRSESHRMEDLISYAIRKTGSKSKIVKVPVPEFHKIVQVENFWMDTDKLKGLGFKPKYSIWESVDLVLAGLK